MRTKKKIVGLLMVLVLALAAAFSAEAAGDRKIALKADKAGKEASGTAVIGDKGNASYSATIGSSDLSKWQLIELAYHPSGDPKNMKELMNTALIGKLKK